MASRRWLVLLAAALVAAPRAVASQEVATGWDPRRVQVTRSNLHQMLERLDQAAGSSSYSKPVRERAATEAGLIRQRLTEGDFQVGDRIMLLVESEPTLTDTFTVVEPRVLQLPTIGIVPLTGVLRSELEPHMQAHMAKFLREPVVHARALIRVSLQGEVLKPGYYVMPSDIVLSEALMVGGGTGPNGKIQKLKILRGGEPIWEGDALQQALNEGRTLDQLNLRAGDQVMVPRTSAVFWSRAVPILLALPATIWAIVELTDGDNNN